MRDAIAGFAVFLAVSLAVLPADAHAKLVQSWPAAGSAVSISPQEIRLKFNEPVAAKLSTIGLATKEGAEVALGPASADPSDKTGLIALFKDSLPADHAHLHTSSSELGQTAKSPRVSVVSALPPTPEK